MEIAFNISTENLEHAFIAALARQDRTAQQQLYQENYGKLMGICLRYAGSRDEALDLLHEGFIKIFLNITKYQTGTSLAAWMRTIIVNTCIDHYRKSMRQRTEDTDSLYSLATDNADIVAHLTEQEILAAVQQLSPAYRTVFNLYVLEGYSHKEISEALDITESTSRSNLVKARLKLQEFFSQKNLDFLN